MEYSLIYLNKSSKLDDLNLSQLVNQLNLIGFEVDDILTEKSVINEQFNNLQLLIKIPANRQDLLNEKSFFSDLSNIFNFKTIETWKHINFLYEDFLLNSNNISITKNLSDKNYLFFSSVQLNVKKIYFSPKWMQSKLRANSIKVHENILDFLNYVNLESGTHFCFGLFEDDRIEELTNFNNENNLQLFLKNFYFDFDIVNFETINFEQFSEIQKKQYLKNSRKSFIQNFKNSFKRLLTLFEICEIIEPVSNISFTFSTKLNIKNFKIIKLPTKFSKTFLNLNEFDLNLFKKAGLDICCITPDSLYFYINTVRKDINRPIDLIEEYSRFFGYENFQELKPSKKLSFYKNNNHLNDFIKHFFLANSFSEVISTPLQKIEKYNEKILNLTNPLNLETAYLRRDLLPKLIEIFSNNLRLYSKASNYFEIGRTFTYSDNELYETEKIAGIFQLKQIKKSVSSQIEWFSAKSLIENFLSNFNISETYQVNPVPGYFHSNRSVSIFRNNKKIGLFGEIHPLYLNDIITKYSIYIFEIDLSCFNLSDLNSFIPTYSEVTKYPIIKKDLSFLVEQTIDFLKLKKEILNLSTFLNSVEFFDIYFDEKNNEKVSVGLTLEFQSFNSTLLSEQIEKELQMIIKMVCENYSAILK